MRVSLRSLTRRLAYIAVLAIGCGASQQVTTKEQPSTNLDRLVEAVRSVGAGLAGDIEPGKDAVFAITCRAEATEVARFVESVVVQEFQRAGRNTLYEANPEMPVQGDGDSPYRLNLTVLQLGIRYADRRGDAPLRKPTVERTASVHLAVKLSSPQGRIIWADERKAEVRDRVAVSAIDWAESGAPSFARNTVPAPGGFFGAVLEPVVVASATGAVIYFFFSFRN